MNKVYSFLGGRKIFFALILTGLSTWFVLVEKSDINAWVNFQIWVYGTYSIANVGEHFTNRKTPK